MGSGKARLAIALVLIAIFWLLNWQLPGLRTHLLFFPLWFGYSLLVDALVQLRTGTSLLTRNPWAYGMLFAASAPAWWMFEALNFRLQNWRYVGREHFSDLEYFLLASVAFSTVIPAVFGTAELIRSMRWVETIRNGPKLRVSDAAAFLAGLGTLTALLLWPGFFFPVAWLSLWLLMDPLNARLGRHSLLEDLRSGDWRTVLSLALGCLICGFFWELWNFYAYPKWVYDIPFVEYLYVFEMPLLGYGGYLFFGPELFAMYQLLAAALPAPLRIISALEPRRRTVLLSKGL
jgi:hypothetical protein